MVDGRWLGDVRFEARSGWDRTSSSRIEPPSKCDQNDQNDQCKQVSCNCELVNSGEAVSDMLFGAVLRGTSGHGGTKTADPGQEINQVDMEKGDIGNRHGEGST